MITYRITQGSIGKNVIVTMMDDSERQQSNCSVGNRCYQIFILIIILHFQKIIIFEFLNFSNYK